MKKYLIALLVLAGCAKTTPTLKVAATPVPHAEMLNYIKPDLEKEGINLEVVEIDDYNIPNRALANNEVDANFFQHIPFMQAQIQSFHYPIGAFAKIHVEPMGIYSHKIKSLDEIGEGGVVAIPNDPSNEGRALILLEKNGWIELDNPNNLNATPQNITYNPKNLTFRELDAAMLPRTLEEVDAAVINTNYALQANLDPMKDALALEDKDSPYVNVLVIRTSDHDRTDLKALKAAMTSEKMRQYILEKYKGAIISVF